MKKPRRSNVLFNLPPEHHPVPDSPLWVIIQGIVEHLETKYPKQPVVLSFMVGTVGTVRVWYFLQIPVGPSLKTIFEIRGESGSDVVSCCGLYMSDLQFSYSEPGSIEKLFNALDKVMRHRSSIIKKEHKRLFAIQDFMIEHGKQDMLI